MKTILVDGNYILKANFEFRASMFSKGEHCGGSFGFLDSLRSVLNRFMFDRCVVMWDGMVGGKMRHDIYPPYKENRNKSFEIESYYMTDELIDEEKRKKYTILQQKIKVKNYLEELFIRQCEIEEIEADDLIAKYVLDKNEDEEITIFSSDKDYYQLIDDKVSILRPKDDLLITKNNFKEKFGYVIENILTLRCFEGDTSDNISGVDGIAFTTIKKLFPRFCDEEYTIDRIIEESVNLYSSLKKKPKSLEKLIGCRKVFERNKRLMNLKQPFLNEQAIKEVEDVRTCVIAGHDQNVDRGIDNAIKMFHKDGYNKLAWEENVEYFFRPFYRIVLREKEYTKMILEENK